MRVTEPAVTALVPVKEHHPPFLREAIGSLLGQTSPRWHALLIYAPGLSGRLEAELPEQLGDPRIELVRQRGRKLAGALNTGMRAARTDFTAILLADDLWAPEAVAILERNIAQRPEVDFFHSARRIVDDRGEPISGIYPAMDEVAAERFAEGSQVKHLLCWRRSLGLKIGGIDESLNSVGADDYDFPWSLLEAGARFGAIQDCLYVYRDHRSCHRLTTHLPRRTHVRETRRILRKHGVPDPVIARRIAQARMGYLRQCLYSSTFDRWIKRALRHDPAQGWRDSYSR